MLQDATLGDPISGLKWTRKSPRKLVKALRRKGLKASHETIRRLLETLGYSLKVNRKRLGKRKDVDRNRQMQLVVRRRHAFLQVKKPAISVDSKKKELVGNFKNAGQTWRREALSVMTTDFLVDADGKAVPYGVYDLACNMGFVGIGVSHDTAEFAVNVIRAWWSQIGQQLYGDKQELLIQADSGGANSYRSWLWKWELQQFADETGLTLIVTHYPTSASKWNWIEHRLFGPITQNWAGQPLVNYQTILKYIRATKTDSGLRCRAYLDKTQYQTGKKLTREQKESINLIPYRILPKWNYTIRPRSALREK